MTAAERAQHARRLHAELSALSVTVEECAVEVGSVALTSYPDEARPTSTVRIRGLGHVGMGEHVGWSTDVHQHFQARAAVVVAAGRSTVGAVATSLRARVEDPYDRAALEAALIDLALRQSGRNLFDVAGVTPCPVRYVVSLARLPDLSNALTDALEQAQVRDGELELKLDVDPDWEDSVLAALAARVRAGGVAVLDFKGTGTIAAAARIARAAPGPLLEDPPEPAELIRSHPELALASRFSVDAALTSSAQVAALEPRPAAVNVKPARMGGVLEAIATIAECATRDIAIYFGGMWEIGVGRAQLLRLASVLCPDGPNDIASLATGSLTLRRPRRLDPTSAPG